MIETLRLKTLKGYGILDTPNEPAFDALVREIATKMHTHSALISFIDETRQWYKARVGVEVTEVPRFDLLLHPQHRARHRHAGPRCAQARAFLFQPDGHQARWGSLLCGGADQATESRPYRHGVLVR